MQQTLITSDFVEGIINCAIVLYNSLPTFIIIHQLGNSRRGDILSVIEQSLNASLAM